MATTPPDRVRAALAIVANEAAADLRAVAATSSDPEEVRAALFLATPLIVSDYTDGSSALALDWYEELREAANTVPRFAPVPTAAIPDDEIGAIVASTTLALVGPPAADAPDPISASLELLGDKVIELVSNGFRDTITDNVHEDPAAAGWRRFARPEACKFCKMLAAKGAVFTERTARFAAHGAVMGGNRKGGNCQCIAGPEFGGADVWAEATSMQYMASQRNRSAKEKARLREYLNENFPDAPG